MAHLLLGDVISPLTLLLVSFLHLSPIFLSFPAPGAPVTGLVASLLPPCPTQAALKPTLPVPLRPPPLPRRPAAIWGMLAGTPQIQRMSLHPAFPGLDQAWMFQTTLSETHEGCLLVASGEGCLGAERH